VGVHVLGTGGTIAARTVGDRIDLVSVDKLCAMLPTGWVDGCEDVIAIASSTITPMEMLTIATRARGLLLSGASGVVITHGTDTMEETAFAVDLLLGEAAPRGVVVVTGAMRRASDIGPDGPKNLRDAVRVADCPAAAGLGAMICMAGNLHAARWATKVDVSTLDPFSSAPFALLGSVTKDAVRIDRRPPRPPATAPSLDARVAVVRTYPAMSANVIDMSTAEGVTGLVIEGVGVFNVPNSIHAAIGRAVAAGVTVVITSRARVGGGLDQGPPQHRLLHDLGAISSYGLPTTSAYVALMVGLGQPTATVTSLRAWFANLGDLWSPSQQLNRQT
jgi:L-asparaginase